MACSSFDLGDATTVTLLQIHYKKSSDSSFLVKNITTCSDAKLTGLTANTEYDVKLKLFTDLTPAGVESILATFKTGRKTL